MNNSKQKWIVRIIALCMCLITIAGCANSSDNTDTSATDAVTDAATEPGNAEPEIITLVDNGEAKFIVTRPGDLSAETQAVKSAVSIKKDLTTYYVSSGEVGINTDFDVPDPDLIKVYVGIVNNDVATELGTKVGYGEYSIHYEDNGIWIFAQDDVSLNTAVKKFMNIVATHAVINEDGTKTISFTSEEIEMSNVSSGKLATVPAADHTTLAKSYSDYNNRNYINLQNVTAERFNNYETKLKTAGYTCFYRTETTQMVHAFYYNSTAQLELTFIKNYKHLNLVSQPKEGTDEIPTFYALVVKDSVKVCKTAAADNVAAAKAKYDVLTVVSTENADWFELSGEGEGKYIDAQGVEVFMSLSALKGEAAVIWARDIANDNEFHYGDNAWSHKYGCYFCGTNGTNSSKVKAGAAYEDQLKTYCCNPLCTAAYCHGAGAVKVGYDMTECVKCSVGSMNINLANDSNKALSDKTLWMWFEKPASVIDLIPGDLLMTPKHVVIYSGDGKLIEASGGDDNVKHSSTWDNSIREKAMSTSAFDGFTKLVRYIGK